MLCPRQGGPATGGLRAARLAASLVITLLGLLCGALFAPEPARAEGSRDLYPTNATCAPNSQGGSCRANLEWRTSNYGPVGGTQIQRRTVLEVYAQAGEVLLTGSSAVGVGSAIFRSTIRAW
jgi:hypothetical protein